jgi:hypothetical protein
MKQRAFSKKEGLPSMSSRASNMGLPTTKDFTGLRSLPEEKTHYQIMQIQKVNWHIKSHTHMTNLAPGPPQNLVALTPTKKKICRNKHNSNFGI